MKLVPLSALSLIAISLLSGCSGEPKASATPTIQSAAPSSPTPSQDATPPTPRPIIVDLTRQVMAVPDTEYGQVDVPIRTGAEANLTGSSVLTAAAAPSGVRPYDHCDDRTVAWSNAGSRPVQFLTFDAECEDPVFFEGRSIIVVPRTVTEHEGEYGTVDGWLSEGREISFVGEAPTDQPNAGVEWPDDRLTFLGSHGYEDDVAASLVTASPTTHP